jgi:adenosylcobinamide-GDP ribazoletransferase
LPDQPTYRRPRQDNHRPDEVPPGPIVEPQEGDPRYPRILHDFVMAMRFFSRLSMGDIPHEAPNLDRMAPAVPIASLVIALLPALAMMLLCLATAPPFVAASVGVGLVIVLTGAMPEDALADSADGLFGGTTIERRLEIMKDSRHGTYGVVAIVLYIVIRIAVLGSIAAVNPLAAGGVMVASQIIARSGALWLSVDLPSAREGGASASAGRIDKRSFAIGVIVAVLLTLILAAPFVTVIGLVLTLLAAAGVASAWAWTCRRLIGGQTGDLIGALQALVEVAVLVLLSVFA